MRVSPRRGIVGGRQVLACNLPCIHAFGMRNAPSLLSWFRIFLGVRLHMIFIFVGCWEWVFVLKVNKRRKKATRETRHTLTCNYLVYTVVSILQAWLLGTSR